MAIAPLPAAVRAEITDLASGKAWILAMIAAGLMYHLEDDPAGLVGEVFDEADVPLIRERVAALYRLNWGAHEDPLGYCLDVQTPGWRIA